MRQEIDQQLIEKAIKGDAAAFSELYLRLRDSIYGFAFRMLGEKSLAEDVTQETFVFFIEHPEKYQRERGSLLSFLCGVARNRIMHRLRKRGNRLEISVDETEDYIEPRDERAYDPLKILLEQELGMKVDECIANLPPLQREVLILRELQELSYEEIARVTGSEIGAAKVRLHRARQRIARQLAPYLSTKGENCHGLQ